MERRLLRSAALMVLAVLASACPRGKTGAGGNPTDTPNDSPRAATSPDRTGRKLDHEPNAVGERTNNKAMQIDVDVQGLAEDADIAPLGAGAEPERPTAANTGPSKPDILVPYTGPSTITENGATYENFTTSSALTIDADNVTLRNFVISTGTAFFALTISSGHSGVLLEDGEITAADGVGLRGVGFTGRRLHIHDTGSDAMKTQGTGGPTVVEYSFFEKLGLDSSKPAGNQISTRTSLTKDVTFRYNNIWMPVPNSPNWPGAPYASNACFIHSGTIQNVLIENNWINGGNFSVYCGVPGVSIRNNRFGRDYKFGIRKGTCDAWSGNIWDDTEEPVYGDETK